jgi:hypothetical protein
MIDFNYKTIGASFMGTAATFFFVMNNQLSHYELFGEFLITIALSLVSWWWYPIYMEERNGDS